MTRVGAAPRRGGGGGGAAQPGACGGAAGQAHAARGHAGTVSVLALRVGVVQLSYNGPWLVPRFSSSMVIYMQVQYRC